MVSRRDVIIEKYTHTKNVLCQAFGEEVANLLPNLEEIDLTDVLFFISLTFTNDESYEQVIKTFVQINNIKIEPEDIGDVIRILKPTVEFIKNLK
jgi:hypothetical protein